MDSRAAAAITAFAPDVVNRDSLQRFLQAAELLTDSQWHQIQHDNDDPTLGDIDLRYGLAPLRHPCDNEILARSVGIAHDRFPSRWSSEFGPGLWPLHHTSLMVAYWTDSQDVKDFIAVYAPFLRHIPLTSLGFSNTWMALWEPSEHEPLVRAYEESLRSNAGRLASPRSSLPDTEERLQAALCFEAALNPTRRSQLADELVELASFVDDQDALAAIEDPAGGVVSDIRDREFALLTWVGGIKRDVLDDASKDVGGSALAIGSGPASRLQKLTGLTVGLYVLCMFAWPVAGIITLGRYPHSTAVSRLGPGACS